MFVPTVIYNPLVSTDIYSIPTPGINPSCPCSFNPLSTMSSSVVLAKTKIILVSDSKKNYS